MRIRFVRPGFSRGALTASVFGAACLIESVAYAQQPSGKELLGKARNLALDELLKPYDAKTTPPNTAPDAFAVKRPMSPAQVAAAELKRRAQPIAYQALARAPRSHVGALVTMRGKVVQAAESYGHATLRIDVTRGQYDIWSDTVYVEYKRQSDSEPRILEKDVVAIWGKFEGIKTYTTVLGATVQIPHVSALILEHSSAPPTVITGPANHRGVYTMPAPAN